MTATAALAKVGQKWTSGWISRACKLDAETPHYYAMCTDDSNRWQANEAMINVSCDALGYSGVPNPSPEELDGILDAITAESKDSGLDQRFLLAIMVRYLERQFRFL